MGSRKELFEWTVDMHNEVNKRNKKKILSYNQAIDELQKNSKKNLASWSDRDLAKALLTSAFLSSLLVFFSYTIAKKR